MEEGSPGGFGLRADGTLTELGDEPAGALAAGGALSPGAELGGRYRIVSRIGAGGMGEVWRALDLKLRVEVALKAVRADVVGSEWRLESLRREVRAAREVVSPNVCRIYDLEEIDGRELVSMEYVDGQTLLDVLRERGPLGLKVAQDIASQFLSGLEAIHAAGLVHRDLKPENIMITRAGRVVVMDFGLARQEAEGRGRVSGTPAYMSPEQGRGEEVDARADVYSAGVVLAEMVSPEGIKDRDSRESLWEGVKSEPPKLPDTPWAPVLKRALAKDREARYRTAHKLTRALEEVTLRVAGAEDLHPYPGLASFTESDAEYFFGREAEVEEMWRKLEGPARLLGLVGPSGAGKTSFLRAGLIPRGGSSWRCLICTPGSNPELSLSRALASELSGDAEEVERLLRFDDPEVAVAAVAGWRRGGEHGLLIVDQLEELFTQNGAEVQRRFADLLNRLALVADVHVLLSLRDDFLLRCHDHPALKPVFFELTPLAAPVGTALRRALTQPALQCGYRFEDDALVEEMMVEVEGERGALPLLAFAAARLWERRDRETGLLTRQAYLDIGGVGGALAKHAEATMDRIGSERIGIVRELFRNLVTAEGTRAVREWHELLSVFDSPLSSRASAGPKGRSESRDPHRLQTALLPSESLQASGDPIRLVPLPRHSLRAGSSTPRPSEGRSAQDDRRMAAAEVLRELVDARLLTSYEVKEEDREPTRRVEIIHESLLANWPRLVRWQTQDADAAQLRDQLRQAARTWDERARSDDMLWTGSAFREYAVWRERYAGGLTELEEAFGRAMTSLATRRRRRRRIAAVAGVSVLLVVLAVVTGLWRRSLQETRRAEAAKLIALGRVELDRNPSAALAFARASLEVAGSAEARIFAVQALWAGPPTLFVTAAGHSAAAATTGLVNCLRPAFSSDGSRLACSGRDRAVTMFFDDGDQPLQITGFPSMDPLRRVAFAPADDRFLTWSHGDPSIRVFSVAGEQIETLPGEASDLLVLDGETFATLGASAMNTPECEVRVWSLRDHSSRTIARWSPLSKSQSDPMDLRPTALDPQLRWLAHGDGTTVRLFGLTGAESGRDIEVHTHQAKVSHIAFAPDGSCLASVDESRAILVSSLAADESLRALNATALSSFSRLDFDASGSRLGWASDSGAMVWNLADPADAAPRLLRGPGENAFGAVAFDPEGSWAAAGRESSELFLWSLASPYPRVLQAHTQRLMGLAFTADSRFLASCGFDGARLWPLSPKDGHQRLIPLAENYMCFSIAGDATSQSLLVAGPGIGAFLIQPEIAAPLKLEGIPPTDNQAAVLDTRAGLAVVGDYWRVREPGALHVVELGSGATRSFPLRDRESRDPINGGVLSLGLTADDSLMSGGVGGVYRWNLATGERIKVCGETGGWSQISMNRSGSSMIAGCWDGQSTQVFVIDTITGARRRISSHGTTVNDVAMDATGERIATGDESGVVRVGWATGEEPHLLFAHSDLVSELEFSPDGRWLASASRAEILLWPMPDLSKPPLHTLPHDELLAKLRSLTNLRAVRDPASTTGWKVEIGPFPGWATVPEWNP